MSSHPIVDVLNRVLGGLLRRGAHTAPDEGACILEACSLARGVPFSDSCCEVQMPDIRGLNDAFQSDEARTLAMVRLGVALWDWREWSWEHQERFARTLGQRLWTEFWAPALRDYAGIGDVPESPTRDYVGNLRLKVAGRLRDSLCSFQCGLPPLVWGTATPANLISSLDSACATLALDQDALLTRIVDVWVAVAEESAREL